jgi:restriction endonuclease S subunit
MLYRKYVYYALLIGMEKIVREANAVSLKTFNKSDWDNLILPIPPRSEQDQIIHFLDEKTALVTKYINKINNRLV